MSDLPRDYKLISGETITLRHASLDDAERIHKFFLKLPEENRIYLMNNVIDIEVVKHRLRQIDKSHFRIIALLNDEVVADGTIDHSSYGWYSHIGHVRIMVSHEQRHKGIGTILLNELIIIATREKVEKLCVDVMAEQRKIIETLKKIGFKKELLKKNYAKDIYGNYHDVCVLSNDISKVWRKFKEHVYSLDVNYSRLLSGM